MDIAGVSTALAYQKDMNQIGTAMLKKSLDMMEQSGAAMIAMMDRSMELSVNPGVGGNFDMSV